MCLSRGVRDAFLGRAKDMPGSFLAPSCGFDPEAGLYALLLLECVVEIWFLQPWSSSSVRACI